MLEIIKQFTETMKWPLFATAFVAGIYAGSIKEATRRALFIKPGAYLMLEKEIAIDAFELERGLSLVDKDENCVLNANVKVFDDNLHFFLPLDQSNILDLVEDHRRMKQRSFSIQKLKMTTHRCKDSSSKTAIRYGAK